MKLPNVEKASVPERKITHYLLDPAHPAGGGKAVFFLRFGFVREDWHRLAEALLRHARENDVTAVDQTPHGARCVIDGPMTAPDGTILNVRSAWFIGPNAEAPRFANGASIAKTPMKPIQELDPVALTCDLPELGLLRGDVGTAVLVHGNGTAYEVEFVGYDGNTVALATLEHAQVRRLDSHDIPHARPAAAVQERLRMP